MALSDHPAAAKRSTSRSAATAPRTPECAWIEAPIVWPSGKGPRETGPAGPFAARRAAGSESPFAHATSTFRIEPERRQSMPLILLAIYRYAKKLYLAIYRGKRLLADAYASHPVR